MEVLSLADHVPSKILAAPLAELIAVMELAPDGTILNANTKYLELTGYSFQEIIGRNYNIFCSEEDAIFEDYDTLWEIVLGGSVHTTLFCRKRKDGSLLWMEAAFHTFFSQTGEVERIIKTCMDVTAQVESNAAQKARIADIEQVSMIAEYSREAEFASVNENFLFTLELTQAEVIGKTLEEVFPSLFGEEGGFEAVWRSLCSGRSFTRLMKWRSASGRPVWLESTFTPVFGREGRVARIIQVSVDVTARKIQEQEKENMLGRLLLIMDKTHNAVVMTDENNKALYVNSAFTRLFGYQEWDMLGTAPSGILGPGEQAFLEKRRRELASNGACTSEEIAHTRCGQHLWVSWLSTAVQNQEGKCEYIINVVTDITDAKLHELLQDKALEGMAKNKSAADVLGDVCREVERIYTGMAASVVGLDSDTGMFTFAASSNAEIAHRIKNLKDVDEDSPSARAILRGETVIEPDISSAGYPKRVKDMLWGVGIRSCLVKPVFLNDGKAGGAVSFHFKESGEVSDAQLRIADIVSRICAVVLEKDAARKAMRRLTFFDKNTDLPNRTLLMASSEQLLASVKRRSPSTPLAVLVIDINRFQRVNNSIGYSAGCLVLRMMAKRLRGMKRKGDVIGRLTADEFGMVLYNCNAAKAEELARKLVHTLQRPYHVRGTEIRLTVRIGVSLYPSDNDSMEMLYHYAYTAVTSAREYARPAVLFFNAGMETGSWERMAMESKLRGAIEKDTLCLHFQPQVCLSSGSVYGVEALCRWEEQDIGFIPPSVFIPLAEETGLIGDLTFLVLQKACSQLKAWREKGCDIPRLSVNLSSSCFQDPKLLDNILLCLQKHSLCPSDLMMELTENVLLESDASILDCFEKMHAAGIALSLDDFGTGYSSLSYLHKLPISEIKLDQSFVRDMQHNEVSLRLSQAISHIGNSLNIVVLAEGIENKSQFSLLKKQRYQVGQGYMLSRPLTPAGFEAWYAKWNPSAVQDQYSLL